MSPSPADVSAATRGTEEQSRSPSWFDRPLTVKHGLILAGLLLPAACIPYLLLCKRLDVVTREIINLRSASVSFASEMRTARKAVASGSDASVSGRPLPSKPKEESPPPSISPETIELLHHRLTDVRIMVKKNQRKLDTLILGNGKVRSLLQDAKVAGITWEKRARIWRDKTSDLLFKLQRERSRSERVDLKKEDVSHGRRKPKSKTQLEPEGNMFMDVLRAAMGFKRDSEPTVPQTDPEPTVPQTDPEPTVPQTDPEPIVPPAEPEPEPAAPITNPEKPSPPTDPDSTTLPTWPTTPPADQITPAAQILSSLAQIPSSPPAELELPPPALDNLDPDEPLLLNLMNTRMQLLKRMHTIVYHQRVTDPGDVDRQEELAAQKRKVKLELEDIDRFVRERHRRIDEEEARRRGA